MKISTVAVIALPFVMLMNGCATTGGGGGGPAAVTTTDADPFKSKAESLESEGKLRQALDAWNVALTANPNDASARQRKEQLQARISQLVAEQMQLAEQAMARKSIIEARRLYLGVLVLDPNNGPAFEALRTKAREVRTLSHTVRSGESLASISELYYGDRSRAEVIWETNGLPPNPKLGTGSTLIIPEIPGVPFVNQLTARTAPGSSASPGTTKGESSVDPSYVNPLLADAREALGSGDFQSALVSVDRYLSGNPRSSDGLEVKKNALYLQAKAFLGQKKYSESLKTLDQLARLSPNFLDSNRLSADARALVVQENYSEGVKLFREEKLREAIARWRTVLEYDPSHANAKKNIDQAERMLQNLQTQRQKTTP
jgi:tetratricopeptide (TPR) repeat protein